MIEQDDRKWAAVGYITVCGLAVTIGGILLFFVVLDWWPLAIAAVGMLFVIIALAMADFDSLLYR